MKFSLLEMAMNDDKFCLIGFVLFNIWVFTFFGVEKLLALFFLSKELMLIFSINFVFLFLNY
jgi:hypothetical protein